MASINVTEKRAAVALSMAYPRSELYRPINRADFDLHLPGHYKHIPVEVKANLFTLAQIEDLEKMPSKLVVVQKGKCLIFDCIEVVKDMGGKNPTIYDLNDPPKLRVVPSGVRIWKGKTRKSYSITCQYCGDKFTAASSLAKYCLDKPCRLNAWRERHNQ